MARQSTQKIREDLGYLGEDFQIELVKCFIEDQQFFVSIENIINQNMFTEESLRRIVGFMKDRYSLNETVATYKDLDTLIRSKISDTISVERCVAMLEKIKSVETRGIDLIEGYSEKFFKQQNLTKALNKAFEIIKLGEADRYDDIEDIVKKALECNNKKEMGFHIFDNMEDALKEDYRCTIPTGADMLDEAFYGGLAKGELGIIIAPSSVGKAQPLTSRVMTPTGYKLMGDMKIGDQVIGGDGKAHNVIGVFPQGERPVYRVDFSNGCSCECDIDHLWNVNTYYQRTRKTYVRGSGVKNMKREHNPDWSYKTMSLRDIIDRGLIKTRKGKNSTTEHFVFRIPRVKPIEFEYQDTPIDPYLAGYYIGDGCFKRSEITVGMLDYDAAYNEIHNIVGDDLGTFFDKKRNIWYFRINGETRKKCKQLFGECKSSEKVIPDCYLWNTLENRLALIQGLMDSDGSTDKCGHTEFGTKSKKLAEQIQFLFRSIGCTATIKERSTSYFSKKYGKRIDCGIAYRVYITLHDDTPDIYRFKRKLEKIRKNKRQSDAIYIANVEFLRNDKTQCILVDSNEHLYVTEDFIVTHNTSATTGFAATAAVTKTEDNNYKGYKVLHIFFEDEDVNIKRKYYAYLTDIDACDLSLPDVRPKAVEMINNHEWKDMIQRNVVGYHAQNGEFSPTDIKKFIQKQIAMGFKPDLVIVDYFECLKLEKAETTADTEWTREGLTMRKLESIAHEFNLALWCPVQGTKDSFNQEIVGLTQAGGSVKKVQIGHVIISFARTEEMRLHDKLNIFINKFRPGRIKVNQFLGVTFNNGTTKFDFSTCIDRSVDEALDANQQYNTNMARDVKKTYKI